MKRSEMPERKKTNRRSFLKTGAVAASAVTIGAGLLGRGLPALGEEKSGHLPPGDAAILRFLAAAEINAYLASKGADTVDLSHFATIPGSTAQGSTGKPRLTNLMNLNVDTSFWTRYRIDSENPDLDPNFVFPQAVAARGDKTIPRQSYTWRGIAVAIS